MRLPVYVLFFGAMLGAALGLSFTLSLVPLLVITLLMGALALGARTSMARSAAILAFVLALSALSARARAQQQSAALSQVPAGVVIVEGVVVDVGTGSGCIALALLAQREGLRVIAIDLSAQALAMAKKNAERHGLLHRLELREGDLLGPCADVKGALLVVSNPPYVLRGSALLHKDVANFEPALALYGEDDDGLGHHRRIIAAAAGLLHEQGRVLLEIGADQGEAARSLLLPGFAHIEVKADLAGHPRVVVLAR